MNTTSIFVALAAVAVGAGYLFRRARYAPADRGIEVGEVSTRWLADKRREGRDDR
jgi:hypothetical protein